MTKINQLYLVGQPGAGKALLGKWLAQDLGWRFINTDFGIEAKAGKSMDEILCMEDNFLNFQLQVLQLFEHQQNIIINTDPTIVCSETNRKFLSLKCVVFLDVNIANQTERMSRNPDPFFSSEDFLQSLHQKRDDFYRQVASLKINTNDNNLTSHLSQIKEYINEDESKVKLLPTFENYEIILLNKLTFKPVRLTEKQAICLRLFAEGKSAKEIAVIMQVSFRTVESYMAKMIESTGCKNSKEILALYLDKNA